MEAAKAYVEADWIQESETLEVEASSDEEAEQAEQLECVACDKIFKSEKALANHARLAAWVSPDPCHLISSLQGS